MKLDFFFYKAQPSQSLHFKGEKCTGGKYLKLCCIVLVGANMDDGIE